MLFEKKYFLKMEITLSAFHFHWWRNYAAMLSNRHMNKFTASFSSKDLYCLIRQVGISKYFWYIVEINLKK